MKSSPLLYSLVIALANSIPIIVATPIDVRVSPSNLTARSADLAPTGYKSIAYFTEWSIYDKGYNVWEVPCSQLTHILYAFANVASDGAVSYPDTWADLSKFFPAHDSGYSGDNNVHGNVNQIFKLKQQNRNLKSLLSIGGWGYSTGSNSEHFPNAASTPQSRSRFAETAVDLLKDGGFDGIDIDWEYPRNKVEGRDFALLLETIRSALDKYAAEHAGGHHFLLTIASSPASKIYDNMPLAEMEKHLDFFNVMTYDFSGSWGQTAGHQANLFPSKTNPTSTPEAADTTITDYVARGVPAHKLVLGVPIYGRVFQNTGGPGQSFSGIGAVDSAGHCWEAGTCDYKGLPKTEATETYDPEIGASYSYDPATQEFISYDNRQVVRQKGEYIQEKGLGGAMFWETSADKVGAGSLIGTMADALGYNLEQTPNWLSYPESKYENVKAGMPGL